MAYVGIFIPKIPNVVNVILRALEYKMMLYGIFGHLEYFMLIGYIL
jgi:hypothetical protein